MDKKKKFRIVVLVPVIAVLIVLGLLTGLFVASGALKAKPPTALAMAVPSSAPHS